MRWRQIWNEELGKSEFIPIDEAARKAEGGTAIHGPIEAFVSPIDGTVISDRKQLREHNKRHNVVSASEFSDDFYAKKREERERLFEGKRTKEQIQRDRRKIYEIINHYERA